jgi:glutaminyl-peptide cyclotransferase
MNLLKYSTYLSLVACSTVFVSCGEKSSSSESSTTEAPKLVAAPAFNADSAYVFVEKQVKFGPRIPNTAAHVKCGDYLVATLKKYGCEVIEQKFKPVTYDGKVLNARNIIGSINPQATKRILLASHWDTRPFSDDDSTAKTKPFDSANDGPSGVGVIFEILRTIQASSNKPNIGIDVVLFDVEDWGPPDTFTGKINDANGGWLMGSEYWSRNLHKPNYSAYFGILLDMVGAKGATFTKDNASMQFAPAVVNNVWSIASQLGYGQYFLNQEFGSISDDHVPVNQNAKINMIDICDLRPNSGNTFGDYHHTQKDNMSIIEKGTLKAVGQTLLQVLYQESTVQ